MLQKSNVRKSYYSLRRNDVRFNYDVCFSYLKKGKFEETPYQKPQAKTPSATLKDYGF